MHKNQHLIEIRHFSRILLFLFVMSPVLFLACDCMGGHTESTSRFVVHIMGRLKFYPAYWEFECDSSLAGHLNNGLISDFSIDTNEIQQNSLYFM